MTKPRFEICYKITTKNNRSVNEHVHALSYPLYRWVKPKVGKIFVYKNKEDAFLNYPTYVVWNYYMCIGVNLCQAYCNTVPIESDPPSYLERIWKNYEEGYLGEELSSASFSDMVYPLVLVDKDSNKLTQDKLETLCAKAINDYHIQFGYDEPSFTANPNNLGKLLSIEDIKKDLRNAKQI